MRVIQAGDYVKLAQLLDNGDFDPIDALFELFEVEVQDARLLKTVLLCWPDLNVANPLGESAIHLAAKAQDTTYLKILLNQTSMNPNQFGPCGNTPLMMTVNNENVEAI